MHRLTLGGYDFAYTDAGACAPIVCIHGSVDDIRTWSRQAAPFAEHHRVIAYSRRWHWPNAASAGEPQYRAVDHADDLTAVIEALGVGPAHLVGASYGAIISMIVAVRRPEFVKSLVLCEPPLFTLLSQDVQEAHMARTILPARALYDAGTPAEGVASFLEAILGSGSFGTFPEAAKKAALENTYEFGLEVHSTLADYFGPLTRNDLRTVRAPALLVRGERSPKIFGDVLDVLAATLPGVQRLEVPGASHGMHRHNPAVYNEAVLRFIDVK
jgi:non-heme chloroperoxidase